MADDVSSALRAVWPADDSSLQDGPAPSSDQSPDDGELTLAADHPAHPWVTNFRNNHYAEAAKLAGIIGNGATPDEVLAVSGNEFDWGRDPKANVHGNYFGLHSKSIYQKDYFPGQTGYIPSAGDGSLATFDPQTGFFYSGLRFANRMKSAASDTDLSDPNAFFSLAHQRGWGASQKDYLDRVKGAYATLLRSAHTPKGPVRQGPL